MTLLPQHEDRLTPEALSLLEAVAGRSWASETYLAGSAALTLYLGHRAVHGLDLMSGTHRLASANRRDLMEDLLELDPESRVETARDGFLYVRSGVGVGLRLFYYPYPLIAPTEECRGLEVASALDLGLMKLGAIISRGTRRDFVDLYLLSRQLPLAELLERSTDKFGHVRDFPLQALKGLADLSLTEGEGMPQLSQPLAWETVVEWLRGEVRDHGRRAVGLDSADAD